MLTKKRGSGMKEAKIIEYEGDRWVTCPYCNKRLIKLDKDSHVKKLPYKCKDSHCKNLMIINVEPLSQT